jgi:multidrug transporter EmrE-like cation transporter
MTIINVLMMTLSELFGNTHLKWYSENQKKHHLALGLVAYLGVIFFLIRSFAGKSMMWTCIMWEAMIVIGGAIVAFVVFGEKFNHWIQWLGILLALGAALCVNYECPQTGP